MPHKKPGRRRLFIIDILKFTLITLAVLITLRGVEGEVYIKKLEAAWIFTYFFEKITLLTSFYIFSSLLILPLNVDALDWVKLAYIINKYNFSTKHDLIDMARNRDFMESLTDLLQGDPPFYEYLHRKATIWSVNKTATHDIIPCDLWNEYQLFQIEEAHKNMTTESSPTTTTTSQPKHDFLERKHIKPTIKPTPGPDEFYSLGTSELEEKMAKYHKVNPYTTTTFRKSYTSRIYFRRYTNKLGEKFAAGVKTMDGMSVLFTAKYPSRLTTSEDVDKTLHLRSSSFSSSDLPSSGDLTPELPITKISTASSDTEEDKHIRHLSDIDPKYLERRRQFLKEQNISAPEPFSGTFSRLFRESAKLRDAPSNTVSSETLNSTELRDFLGHSYNSLSTS